MGWASMNEDNESRVNSAMQRVDAPSDSNSLGDTPQPRSRGVDKANMRDSLAGTLANGSPMKNDPTQKSRNGFGEFTVASARPLPVIVLADVSGSIAANGKIEVLNKAVAEMIAIFSEEDDTRAEIHVSVITFGAGGAKINKPLKPAGEITWADMAASGGTPLGGAFMIAQQLIEDRNVIPRRAYRPTIVLVSDGVPTDDWKSPLASLVESERASKASRFAMAIGEDADKETLKAFLADGEARVFEAHEAREIKKFFRWVTMSVTTRSRSANPNSVVVVEPTDLDEFDF